MLTIRHFKRFYQVVSRDGFTVAQFTDRRDAEAYVRDNGHSPLPMADEGIGHEILWGYKTSQVKRLSRP